jgi:hypothetical protein
MTPRKHADLIKSWADGADIQVRIGNNPLSEWSDAPDPTWQQCYEYRIKPEKKVIRYRRYLQKSRDEYDVLLYDDRFTMHIEDVENHYGFIRWIDTEWQEVEA